MICTTMTACQMFALNESNEAHRKIKDVANSIALPVSIISNQYQMMQVQFCPAAIKPPHMQI